MRSIPVTEVMAGPMMAVKAVMCEMAAVAVVAVKVAAEKSVAETATKAVKAAESLGHGVGFRQRDSEQERRSNGNGFS